ncbi:MAG: autotransporter outer membrane beta-barrel domain-containing protein, partial [Pseudomonadales bacterium]|uniref:autotransporter outer membrane beta-barrel domain-containing protein n=1 Tax=Moritella sp. TaxID=78556 RepID=UPI001E052699
NGYEKLLNGNRVGLFVGVSQSQSQTKVVPIGTITVRSVIVHTTGGFIGTYMQNIYDNFIINSALAVGYESHNRARLIVDRMTPSDQLGDRMSEGKYDSIYMTPSLTIIRSFDQKNGIKFRPSLYLQYSHSYFNSYKEIKSIYSNLSVKIDGHNTRMFGGRLQLAGVKVLGDINNGGEIEIRTGIKYRHHDDNGTVLTIPQTNPPSKVSYDIIGENNIFGGYIGSNFTYTFKDDFNITADIEYGRSAGNEKNVSGNLSFNIPF